jgi:hypothetical protein
MPIDIQNNIINTRTFGPTGVSSNPLTLDGSTATKAAPSGNWLRNKCGINTNGMYWLNPGGLGANQFYCDFTFDNQRVWVMVVANRLNTNGLSGLTYASTTAAQINTTGTYNSSLGFNLLVGLPYWKHLGDTICQYVSSSNVSVSGSHTKRARWKFNGFTSTYGYIHPRDVIVDVGSGNPGWYAYHAVNGFNLTTYDNDQDQYGINCSTLYANNPWWYGACWDGNYFAGGSGYVDGPYWSGSGEDYHNYGAAFLSFTDL